MSDPTAPKPETPYIGFVAGFLFLLGAISADDSKPLKPFFGHQITAIDTFDVKVVLYVAGIMTWIAIAWNYRQEETILREEFEKRPELRGSLLTKVATITFAYRSPENPEEIKRKITEFIDSDPKANLNDLKSYERQIGAR